MVTTNFYKHETAIIDSNVEIGHETKVWHFSHISSDVKIGSNCVLGQNTFIGQGVKIGSNVKIQNNVSVYSGTTIEDDVFLGPSCVLTNISNPRSQISRQHLYEKTLIKRGATIGANATIVCSVTIGQYAFVAAGAVITKNVPDYAQWMGVPSKQTGWVSRHGHILKKNADGIYICPESHFRYKLDNNIMRCLDLNEQSPLPSSLAKSELPYNEYKNKNASTE